ncbi:MAG: tetratricopeptide repeat protein [Bacteroidetes bacterium]|nr:tetratricopeptide repeat protein [Bacteroidota bacterium]
MNKTIFIFFCLMVFGLTTGIMAQDQKKTTQPASQKIQLFPDTLHNKGSKSIQQHPAGTPAHGDKPAQKELTPQQKEAQVSLNEGLTKAKNGDYEGAITDFTKSLKSFENAMTYMNRGYCYMLTAKYSKAIVDENKSIELVPANPKAFYIRGASKYYINDLDGAIKDLFASISYDRKNPFAFNYIAAVKMMKQDYKGALDNYDNVIKLDSAFEDVFTNRGMVHHYLQDYNGAIIDYNIALKRDPVNSSAFNNRGAAKMMLKDYEGALQDFNKAIELRPKYADAFTNRGRVKQFIGDMEGACKDWNTAFDLGITEAKDLIIKNCK